LGKIEVLRARGWWSNATIEPLAGLGYVLTVPGRVLCVLPLLGAAALIATLLSAWPLCRRCDNRRGLPAVIGTFVGLVALAIQRDEAADWRWMLYQPDQKATLEVLHRVGGLARQEGIPRSQLVRIFDPCFRPWNGSVLHDHPDTFHLMELAAAAPDAVAQPLPDPVARRQILAHLTQYERTVLGAGACVSFNPPRLSADAKTVAVARRVAMGSADDIERPIHWPATPISRVRVQCTGPGEFALSAPPRLLR
jgi:hypothetical protein